DFWGRQSRNVLSLEHDASCAGFYDAENHFHCRAFAAGVAAEQADDFARVHMEVQVEMHLRGIVKGLDMFKFQERRGWVRHSCSFRCGTCYDPDMLQSRAGHCERV